MLHNFPKVSYQIPSEFEYTPANVRLITNVFARISLNPEFNSSRWNVVENYKIKGNETPETIAFKEYGSTSLWWILLFINPQKKRQEDWPVSNKVLQDYLDANYGRRQYKPAFEYDVVEFNAPYNFGSDVTYTPKQNIREFYFDQNDQKKLINFLPADKVDAVVQSVNEAIRKI